MWSAAFVLLIVAGVFLPFIPMLGPLSADDLLPVSAVGLGGLHLLTSRRALKPDATLFGFAALALFALISSAANAQSIADFLRLSGRSVGRMVFYLVLIVTARDLLCTGGWAQRALRWFALAATVEALFSVVSYALAYRGPYGIGVVNFGSWSVLKGNYRAQGTFGAVTLPYESAAVGVNFLAAYMVLAAPVAFGLALDASRASRRFFWAFACVLQLVTLYLTFTRGALIALGGGVLAMGWFLGRGKVSLAVLVLGAMVSLSIPKMRAKIFGESHDRYALYWAASQMVSEHPFTGIGDGYYMQLLHENQRYFDTPYGAATASAHNSVLLSTANHGLLGGAAHLSLYILLLGVLLQCVGRAGGDPLTAGAAAGIAGFLLQDQFNDLAYVPKVITQMWFLFALLPLLAIAGAKSFDEHRSSD